MASKSLLDTDPDEPLPEIQHNNGPEKPLATTSTPIDDFGDFQSPGEGEGADQTLSPRQLAQSASSAASYFSYPVKYAMSSALRRLSQDIVPARKKSADGGGRRTPSRSNSSSSFPNLLAMATSSAAAASHTPPRTMTPPFQPPPLTPLKLTGYASSTSTSSRLLGRQLAEEIRLLVPPRLQIANEWRLLFSLDQDGASLQTLYSSCDDGSSAKALTSIPATSRRGGCVLVIKDSAGDTFGAYLTDAPHPSNGHYYGHGECFLWRSSILSAIPTLASLPPPPSEDTTHATRMTTIGPARRPKLNVGSSLGVDSSASSSRAASGASTPERLRFKAFPYSGENDYLIFCEHDFLSVGGGDGHYGLWLDAALEKGVSQSCPTFGNEPLSDEDKSTGKFDVLGVEVWWVG